jgi:hypothetical protein
MDDYLNKRVRTAELQTTLERWKLTQIQPFATSLLSDGSSVALLARFASNRLASVRKDSPS